MPSWIAIVAVSSLECAAKKFFRLSVCRVNDINYALDIVERSKERINEELSYRLPPCYEN